jgi:flagellar biogenesis protein FliO
VTGWLLGRVLGRLRGLRRPGPRLALLERIALAPRQSLALVEAEGRRFLVATSAEGAPAFYALDERARPASGNGTGAARAVARVSW